VGPRAGSGRDDVVFFETDNRVVQLAAWRRDRGPVLFFRQTDPEFLADAERLITGRQIFAQLRLSRAGLARSFFYPFVVIYAISVALALERLAEPLRRLLRGTERVARGDWRHQVSAGRGGGGETGRLVEAFNAMVSQLDEQQRRLVDVEKMASWRDVARHLAHEIKNPLLPIRLTVEEIRDQYRGDDAGYRDFLAESTRVVGDEVDHLQQLVKSFSAFAKMPEPVPVRASLDGLVGDIVRLYPQLDTTIEGSAPELDLDPDQMRRVITNLFDNVVSVAGEGAAVHITLACDGDDAALIFADNGPGIPEEHLARVFEPYFTTREDGTGLGLAMLKSIVLAHGGTVTVDSAVGTGTTFTIRLPLPANQEQRKETP
jgi:nitrogen fixation/metabolism regulation signal transduction histidine kinase